MNGVGLGLRSAHYEHVLGSRPAVPWFEVISENYMGLRGGQGGRPLETIERVRRDYSLALHGVSLNIGSADPLNEDYLARLKSLAARLQPSVVSDHLCWTGAGGQNLHDLLPLPYTEEALRHLVPRVRKVQELLGQRLALENVSSYITYAHSEMTEWEFFSELCERADCSLLLDVNNVYVSAVNHGFKPEEFLRGLPADRVVQMHLAGYSSQEGFLVDTHDHPVSEPVWEFYGEAVRLFGDVPTLIEWDENIPAFTVLEKEAARAEKVRQEVLRHACAAAR